MSEAEGEDGVSITVSPWVLMKTSCKAMRQEVGKRKRAFHLDRAVGKLGQLFGPLLNELT